MTDVELLENAVAANPDEEAPALMLADAYREAGFPDRAEAVLMLFRTRQALKALATGFALSVAQALPTLRLINDSFTVAAGQMARALAAAVPQPPPGSTKC